MHDELVKRLGELAWTLDAQGRKDDSVTCSKAVAALLRPEAALIERGKEVYMLRDILRRIRSGHMIQPSILARNWEAYELLREIDDYLAKVNPSDQPTPQNGKP